MAGEKQVSGPVSSLSLGSDCIFRFRKKGVNGGDQPQVLKLLLTHGDMLIMVRVKGKFYS